MSTLAQDLRYGIRMLVAGRAVTVVAIVTLALGIGANAAIFSIVNAILLEPLPYERPDELLLIGERHGQRGISVAWPNYVDYRAQNDVFTEMGAAQGSSFNLTTTEAEPERLVGTRVTASYFRTLGIRPLVGRTFTDGEDATGAERVVVISEGLWRRRFGADPAILGRVLTLSGAQYTIVGVLPAAVSFQNPPTELWTALGYLVPNQNDRGNHPGITVVARMKPGVTIERARASMDAIASRLEAQFPATNSNIGVMMDPLHERVVGRDLQRALVVLLGAVAFVLLIACANVANLLLARGAARQREIAVRTALGASRWRLVRQLLIEAVTLAAIGGIAGLIVGAWGLRLLLANVPDNLARVGNVRMDTTVFAFTAGLALLTGIIFGIAPAVHAASPDLNETLKEGGRSGSRGTRAQRVRSTLVVGQVALSLVLLIGAGLMLRSFSRLQGTSPGFDGTGVVSAAVGLPAAVYPDNESKTRFMQRVTEQISSTPGVEAAGSITPLPIGGSGWQTAFAIEGRPEPELGQYPVTDIARITPDYFKTLGIRLLRGRPFDWRDNATVPEVGIIDETFAESHFPGEDPLGHRIRFAGHGAPPGPWITIVGVVNHVKNYGIDQESRVELYVPYMQSPVSGGTFVVKGPADTAALVAAVRAAVRAADPTLPVHTVRTMEEYLGRTMTSKRLSMLVLALFAGVALTLAAVGLYGVMSYAVTQRTSEIGIRMALGAHPRDVLRLVVGQGLVLTILGLVAGLAGAFALTRLMETLLFGVSATDPWTFTLVAALLASVALLATYVPARRASKVDPLIALRYE